MTQDDSKQRPEGMNQGQTPETPAQADSQADAQEPLKTRVDIPDNLGQAIEVEEMSESQELRARREQMRSKVHDSVTKITEPEMSGEGLLQGDTGGEAFSEMLKEANLSPRHLRFCCGGILLVGLLAFGIYAAFKWIELPSFGRSEKPNKEEVTEVSELPEETPIEEILLEDALDASLAAGVEVALDEGELDIATVIGGRIGEQAGSETTYMRYVNDFKQAYELYKVDVPRLLNQSKDRTETLGVYLNQLKFSRYLVESTAELIRDEDAEIVRRYQALEDEAEESEDRFFERLTDLNATASESALNAFVDQSQRLVELKAQHQARTKLLTYYQDLLPELERKIRDIELNREALIKGVRVVDVEGSDIELIIDEQEL